LAGSYSKYFRGEHTSGRCRDSAIVTGGNFLINAAVQFVAKAMGLRKFSVHKTVEEGLAALQSREIAGAEPADPSGQ
jgi:RAB protein geranylgeranyltransferase component A